MPVHQVSNTSTRRIVIVGGGVAGVLLATRLGQQLGRTPKADILLVDGSPTHIWKPMLHALAAGTASNYQQQLPYLEQARTHHFHYVPGYLERVDPTSTRIWLAPIFAEGKEVLARRELVYDTLILAYGSQANDFGTPGVQSHCAFIDSQQQANAFNESLRINLARAALIGGDIRIAIVGGGATGVELAAELSRMMDVASGYGPSDIRQRLRMTLIESAPRILSAFPERISHGATLQLKQLGVDVRTGVKVSAADENGFMLDQGGRVDATLRIWAAGIKGGLALALPMTHTGQLRIGSDLRIPGHPSIFALGDCASLQASPDGKPLPATAQVANEQAEHLSRHLPRWLLDGLPIPAFTFRDRGSLVSLSEYNAFGTLGRFGFFKGGFIRGRFAQLAHAALYRQHQIALYGLGRALLLWFAERANALVQPKIRIS